MSERRDHKGLVALECDECGCLIAVGPKIAESGWTVHGMRNKSGSQPRWDACPEHERQVRGMRDGMYEHEYGRKPDPDAG